MMKTTDIPDRAWIAAAFELSSAGFNVKSTDARKALAAAINAWPGMESIDCYEENSDFDGKPDRTVIELPLPQEKNDD